VTNLCPLCKASISEVHAIVSHPIVPREQRIDTNTEQDIISPENDNEDYSGDDEDDDEEWIPDCLPDEFTSTGEPTYETIESLLFGASSSGEEGESDQKVQESRAGSKKRRREDTNREVYMYRCIFPGCPKAFRLRHDCLRHEVSHKGDDARIFLCDKCDKGFKLKGDLERHMFSHQPKQFSCTKCGEAFSIRGNLSRHIKTKHEKLKRFACTECGKKFGQSNDLKRHVLTHNPSICPFECKVCDKKFAQKKNYMCHLKTSGHKSMEAERLEEQIPQS